MITFTTFNHLKDTSPQLHQEDWGDFCSRFKTPQIVSSKDDKIIRYSFAEYKEGASRGVDGIKQHHGIILDFDFKDGLPQESPQGVGYIESLLSSHGIYEYKHIWHTTFSYETSKPNFRLFLPLEVLLLPEDYSEGVERLAYLFEDTPSLDACATNGAHIYAGACVREKHDYHYNSCDERPCLDPSALPFKSSFVKFSEGEPPQLTLSQKVSFLGEALRYVDADLSYHDWIKIGMALKTELGEQGFAIWNKWSSFGQKYKGEKEIEAHWKTFTKSLVTGASIIRVAQIGNGENKFHARGYLSQLLESKTSPHTQVIKECDVKDLPDEAFDAHAVFQNWGEFDYKGDLYDLSAYPLLDRLNQAFLLNTLNRRNNMRLAAVLSIAGHILPHHYGCPYETPLYIMGLLPTGTGKASFKHTMMQLLDHFKLTRHVKSKVGSVQGLVKFLIRNNGFLYNLIDEIADYYRVMRKQMGDSRRAEIMSVFKDIYGGKAPVQSDLIKGEECEEIRTTSVSLFWSGPDDVFKYMGVDEFSGGLMNRFLVFVEDCDGDFGAKTKEEFIKLGQTSIELPDFADIKYTFGEHIDLPHECLEYILDFQEKAREKKRELASNDLRGCILSRVGENLQKLAVLTCDGNGRISLEGVKHMAGVIIHGLKSVSYCVNKHFEVTLERRDVISIASRIQQLTKGDGGKQIYLRELYRSLQKIPRKRIEEGLKRLETEQAIKIEEVVRGNRKTKLITPLIKMNEYLKY